MRKKLLNYMEQWTDEVLHETCQRHSIRVFLKMRIADVLPIDNSGISDDLYSFALKSHFDFVITGPDLTALFVVEFDGLGHQDKTQRLRDAKKADLCDYFHLPALRIGAEYVNRAYRNLNLLTWFVEVWFATDTFEKAQKAGHISPDEPFDPSFFVTVPGLKGRFPLWLSAEPLSKIRHLWQQGRCLDFAPAAIIGDNRAGSYLAFGCLRLNRQEGVLVHTAVQSQNFPASSFRLVQELVAFDVVEKVQDVLDGSDSAVSIGEIYQAAREFSASVRRPVHVGLGWLLE